MYLYVDYDADGNYRKTSKAKLYLYFKKHITDWASFSDWLFDMRCYSLIKTRP